MSNSDVKKRVKTDRIDARAIGTSFLLRNGKSYPESGNYWTEKFLKWIKTVQQLEHGNLLVLSGE